LLESSELMMSVESGWDGIIVIAIYIFFFYPFFLLLSRFVISSDAGLGGTRPLVQLKYAMVVANLPKLK